MNKKQIGFWTVMLAVSPLLVGLILFEGYLSKKLKKYPKQELKKVAKK